MFEMGLRWVEPDSLPKAPQTGPKRGIGLTILPLNPPSLTAERMAPLAGFEPVTPSLRILNDLKDFRKDPIPRADESSFVGHTLGIKANGGLSS